MLFLFISGVLTLASAAPSGLLTPLITTQYHAQDGLGQYSYGYSNGLSAKTEIKSVDGITRGGYSYIDAEGKLQQVEYSSDPIHGFRVAASNLPVAPKVDLPHPVQVEDTPEVAEAKKKHLEALELAKTLPVITPGITVITPPQLHLAALAPIIPAKDEIKAEDAKPELAERSGSEATKEETKTEDASKTDATILKTTTDIKAGEITLVPTAPFFINPFLPSPYLNYQLITPYSAPWIYSPFIPAVAPEAANVAPEAANVAPEAANVAPEAPNVAPEAPKEVSTEPPK